MLKIALIVAVVLLTGAGIAAASSGSMLQAVLPGRSDDEAMEGLDFFRGDDGAGAGSPDSPVTPVTTAVSPMTSPETSPVTTAVTVETPATTPLMDEIERLRLEGELMHANGQDFGEVRFRLDDDGRMRFRADVDDLEDLGLREGDVLSVFVDGVFFGNITLEHGGNVSGRLELDTDDGHQVMFIEAGKMVEVKDAAGNVVLSGILELEDIRLRPESPETTPVTTAVTVETSPAVTTALSPATSPVTSPVTTAVTVETPVSPASPVSPATTVTAVTPPTPPSPVSPVTEVTPVAPETPPTPPSPASPVTVETPETPPTPQSPVSPVTEVSPVSPETPRSPESPREDRSGPNRGPG